uniref:non-specific serine/threonine protein kinase n=1 Tax=Oryza glumipatula TaxID=40148 RepID=A0A0D9Y3K7_9ORYZ
MTRYKLLFMPLLLLLLHTQLVVPSSSATSATHTSHTGAPPPAVPCMPDQASALLRLKRSFSITNKSVIAFRSWNAGEDCCRWEGVRCGGGGGAAAGGRVTWLDLGDRGLKSGHLDQVIFKLNSLEYLNLAGNDFNLSEIPFTGFERLSKLTHLNLSSSNFAGQVPVHSIGQLTNLISLDLSFRFKVTELFDMGYLYTGAFAHEWQLVLPNLTALVANLSNLEELRLGFLDLSHQEADWCNALGMYTQNLRVLSLPFCWLSSPICGSLSNLRSLSVIDMQFSGLTGRFPDFCANLSSLSVLQLSFNHLEGWVPPLIFQNKKLVAIDLHRNVGLSGTLPDFPVDSSLEILLVGHTNFSGTIPSSISNLKSLKKLGLDASGFSGELPSTIGTLRHLNSLQISGLEVVESFPKWITNLTSLEVLEFSNCGLHGTIPSFIADLKKLTKLALYACNLFGEIPQHIFNLTQLDTIFLHSNSFTGTVELASFLTLPNLFDLNLSHNKLTVINGESNSSLTSFPNIGYLGLSSCNMTRFPNILRHLNKNEVNGIDLSHNHIQGAIPHWEWENWKDAQFFFLNLSHNEFTNVGYTIFPFGVEMLDLSFNKFEGPIPLPQNSGTVLDYSNNRFSSIPPNISTQLRDTAYFKASRNNISGDIPTSFCTNKLQFLDLSFNFFSGSIPPCLIEVAGALQVLNLKQNQLHGELPHYFNESCTLEALDFSDNRIEGNLPRSLASCRKLEVLDIQNNHIADSFPCWMSALPRLQVLVLKSNKFFGQVAPSVGEDSSCEFPSLRILDLASNKFSGTLSEEWFTRLKSMMIDSVNGTSVMEYKGDKKRVYQVTTVLTYKGSTMRIDKILRTFVFIDVSNNAFHGSVPKAIGELVLLNTLNMSHNSLTGLVPTQLSHLNQMEALDLSSNELSGVIPQELASLHFLTTLNLSYNRLVGRIPESTQFSTFLNNSFLGNDGLCGPPLSKGCDNMTLNVTLSDRKSIDIVLFLFSGLGFGLGFAIAIVIAWGVPIRKWSLLGQGVP